MSDNVTLWQNVSEFIKNAPQNINTWKASDIMNWCYEQHFKHDYYYMGAVGFALFFCGAYFAINAYKKLKGKDENDIIFNFGKMQMTIADVKTELITLCGYSLLIFVIAWALYAYWGIRI